MQATTTTLGRSTGIHLEFRTHHNVSEKGDRVARPETYLARTATISHMSDAFIL